MKTIRTIVATLAAILLSFAVLAWFSVRRNAAFLQRTIYQGFDQTFVVALVMGCAFLLIAVILTVAIASTGDSEEDEEDELPPLRPARRPQAEYQRRPASREEQPYRRVSRVREAVEEEEEAYRELRPRPAPRKRAAEHEESIPLRREETPVRFEKRAAKPQPVPQPKKRPAAKAPIQEDLPEDEAELEPLEPAEPEADEAAAPEASAKAPREEGTVRCVFCGVAIPRDSLFCPHCGKKR